METEPAVLQSLLGCTSVLVKSFHWKAGHCPEAGSGPEHSNNKAHTHPKNHVVEVLVFCMIMVVIEFCVLCIWEDYSLLLVFSWQTGETFAGFPICSSGFYLQKYKICATFV